VSERPLSQLVDGLSRSLGELLKYVELSAADTEMLFGGAAGYPKTLNDRTDRVDDFYHVCTSVATDRYRGIISERCHSMFVKEGSKVSIERAERNSCFSRNSVPGNELRYKIVSSGLRNRQYQ
jgi:hypothetical protein